MYFHHTSDLKLHSWKIHSSRSRIKIIAYGDAILVSTVAPLSCLKKHKLCSKILFFNTHSAKSIRESIDIVLIHIFQMLSGLHHAGYLDIKCTYTHFEASYGFWVAGKPFCKSLIKIFIIKVFCLFIIVLSVPDNNCRPLISLLNKYTVVVF